MRGATKFRRKAAVAAVIVAAGCLAGWYTLYDPAPPGALTSLDETTFLQLKNDFNGAGDSARLIVLLSPT